MKRTQIQLPDEIYNKIKALAKRNEWSTSEAIRKGAEYLLIVYPSIEQQKKRMWELPKPLINLGPFLTDESKWRALANERLQD